jgi:hypothetical protein
MKTFEPLLVNGQPMAVVVPPPSNRDPNAPPKGPWIRVIAIDGEESLKKGSDELTE